MPANSWMIPPGLNSVAAYQVSGRPYATASIDAKHGDRPGGFEIVFPYVSRWFKVINKDEANTCKVAFSVSGMTGSSNYFTVGAADVAGGHGNGDSGFVELKVTSIWVSGSTNVDVVAGLTSIMPDSTQTSAGTNWSGSTGVG